MEKDGSPLEEEKQSIGTSLMALLTELLGRGGPEELRQQGLHSLLAYILSAAEEHQVGLLHHSLLAYVLGSDLVCPARQVSGLPPRCPGNNLWFCSRW